MKTNAFTVRFQPSGLQVSDTGDASILELARRLGLTLESSCGGQGNCRSCAVRIEGNIPPFSASDLSSFSLEELALGWRRACQARPIGLCTVHLPAKTASVQFSHAKDGKEGTVHIVEPIWTLDCKTGYCRRGTKTPIPVDGNNPMGLAVDLGTTNVAAALVDLCTGHVICSATAINPQVAFGADVISRLSHALKGKAQARELQKAAIDAITNLAKQMTDGVLSRIAEVAVVGNTVMQHLLLGLSINSLTYAPYSRALLNAQEIPAEDLGFDFAPGTLLYCAPNIAGFIGGDHLSALLELASESQPGRWAMLDIGTNTEIALCANGQITSVSCASGPAFEGGKLTCGMRAAPGAIDRVVIHQTAEISTIRALPPIGICGSGVLSLVASLKKAGIVDTRGRMKLGHRLIRERGSSREFVISDDGTRGALPIVFTQADVRAVQLAKAAIRAGLDLLLRDARLNALDLDRVFIAGSFGSFIDIEDAFCIGLLPELPRERVNQVGNFAGAGVCRLVACAHARREVDMLAKRIRYLDLASEPSFQKTFIAHCML